MADFVNIATGKPESLDAEALAPALAAGTHMPAGGARAVISPDGQLGTVAASDLQSALQSGYSIPTQAQLDHFGNKAQYGGAVGEATAAGLGFLRGQTGGLSDAFIGGRLASSPEATAEYQATHPSTSVGPGGEAEQTAKALQEVNPIASGAGELAGFVAPGAGGAISALGHGVESAVLGEGAGAAGKIGAKIAGGAAEGAAFGAGNAISEAGLGDPGLTAEKVAAHIGLGAILGGAAGGFMKAGALGLPVAGAAAGKAAGAVGLAPADLAKKVARVFTGVPEEAITGYLENPEAVMKAAPMKEMADSFIAATENMKGEISGDSGKSFKLLDDSGKTATIGRLTEPLVAARKAIEDRAPYGPLAKGELKTLDTFISDIHDVGEKLAGPGEQETAAAAAAEGKAGPIIDQMKAEIEKIQSEYPAGGKFDAVIEQLKSEIKNLGGEFAASAPSAREVPISQAKYLIQQMDENIAALGKSGLRKSNPIMRAWTDARGNLNEMLRSEVPEYGTLMDELANKVQKTKEISDAFRTDKGAMNLLQRIQRGKDPYAAEALADFDKTAGTNFLQDLKYSYIKEAFTKETTQGSRKVNLMGSIGSVIGGLVGTATGVPMAGHVVGAAIGATGGAILDKYGTAMVKKVLDDVIIPGHLAKIGEVATKATNVLDGIGPAFLSAAGRVAPKLATQIGRGVLVGNAQDHIDEIRAATKNPEALINHLHAVTASGQVAAPKTMAALQQTAARGLAFLASKAPVHEADGPFSKAPPISALEAAKFDRYYAAVHEPMAALQELAAGSPNPEALEALQAVYPKLLADARQSVFAAVAGHKDRTAVPYAKRLAVSRFMGQALDASLNPQSIQRVQGINQAASAARTDQKTAAGPHPTQGGLAKLTIAERQGTMFQHAGKES